MLKNNRGTRRGHPKKTLFVFVPIFSEFLLALVGCNFSEFTLSSAGHFNPSFLLMRQETLLSMHQTQKKVKGARCLIENVTQKSPCLKLKMLPKLT
jgi:hypothetical protein